jgi:Domain of unknown function (DUF1731)
VIPGKLSAAGHRFRQPDLDQALRHLLGRTLSTLSDHDHPSAVDGERSTVSGRR